MSVQLAALEAVQEETAAEKKSVEALSGRGRSLANLEPWKKGQTGNPLGRNIHNSALEDCRLAIRALAQSKSEHAMKKLLNRRTRAMRPSWRSGSR